MENKKFWFFGSKLNTVLLVILIVLMVIALRWMSQQKDIYFPKQNEFNSPPCAPGYTYEPSTQKCNPNNK